jgi:hypothetical protein
MPDPFDDEAIRALIVKMTTGPNHTARWDGEGGVLVTIQDFFDARNLVELVMERLEMSDDRPEGGQNY